MGNPNRADTTGWFRYSASNPGTCNDAFGSRAPISGGSALGSGISSTSFGQSVSGLSVGATYYYCAIISSSEGTAFGSVLSFTTAAAPGVSTAVATSVSATAATLNGSGNPNAASTMGWFRYATASPGTCNDTFGTRAPFSSGSSLGSGSATVAYAQGLGSLAPATTYYYCAIASNAYGTAFGSVLSFTTLAAAPTVSTNSATNLTGKAGVLTGTGNPGGSATTGWFRYSPSSPGTCNDTFGTRAPSTGGSALGAGATTMAFSQPISGLTPATTYYYCALASNAVGTALGGVSSFTTPSAPTVVTTSASSVAGSSATLNGAGNPNRADTTGWFRYSTSNPGTCNDAFGSRAPISGGLALGSGTSSTSFGQSVSGLSVATTYYFCAIVSSSEGTAFGAVLSFTTAAAPGVSTATATSVTATAATLNGSGNPNAASTTGWFRYATANPGSCNDTFGTRAPFSSGSFLGSGSASVAYAQGLGSLVPATTYYYCAIANNTYGTAFGAVLSFTTLAAAPTVSTNSATNLTGTTGVLNGD